MRETIEFRLFERTARELLPPDLGAPIVTRYSAAVGGPFVRRVELPSGDPMLDRIAELHLDGRARGRPLIASWDIHRRYSPAELEAAEILLLWFHATFEPAGEECGTAYDESAACPVCLAGRRQAGPLRLELRSIPKKDLARTIADEHVVGSVSRPPCWPPA